MARLIDADKLIEDFKNELLKVDFEKLSDNDKLVMNTSAIALRDFVKRQPTAYNIDKVVEELELHSFEFGTDTLPAHYVRLNDAIEIVKAGMKNE